MLKNRQDSEGALQDTYCKAITALPGYREENHFKSWIYRIAHNTAVDRLRKRSKLVAIDVVAGEDLAESHPRNPNETLLQKERYRELQKAIDCLPVAEKQVVLLRLQSDLSFKEIAGLMDEPIGTVLSRMSRAKKQLTHFVYD